MVIITTGAYFQIPNIDGIYNEYVIDAFSFFEDKLKPRGSRALVSGVGLIGREVIEMLANQGFKVVGVDILEELVADFTLAMLKNNPNVELFTGTKVEAFTPDGVLANKNGEVINLGKFDTIISSIGTNQTELYMNK